MSNIKIVRGKLKFRWKSAGYYTLKQIAATSGIPRITKFWSKINFTNNFQSKIMVYKPERDKIWPPWIFFNPLILFPGAQLNKRSSYRIFFSPPGGPNYRIYKYINKNPHFKCISNRGKPWNYYVIFRWRVE